MKLSMWMIVNRLDFMELEVQIKSGSPQILKSARHVYATDCAIVTQDGRDVLCSHGEDVIRLKDISFAEGFELIQSVFDFYQDWEDRIGQHLKRWDYQKAVDECWDVFHNPVTLINGQRRVLAMSGQYREEEMDEEWRYLLRYRYTSPDTLQAHRRNHTRFDREGPQLYPRAGKAAYNSLSCAIVFHHGICGRISLLERDRPLNYGDRQLLGALVEILRLPLAEQKAECAADEHLDIFSMLLEERRIDEEALDRQLGYLGWKRWDTYQLVLIDMEGGEGCFYDLVTDTIRAYLTGCAVLRKKKRIVLITRQEETLVERLGELLAATGKETQLRTAGSLPYPDILDTSFALDQAQYALQRGKRLKKGTRFLSFYDYAADYLLEASMCQKMHALHPGILSLWQEKKERGDRRYAIFQCYLENDRSLLKTAAKLYIHRNTLIYHLRRMGEIMSYDPEDCGMMDYMRLTMRLLELNDVRERERKETQALNGAGS